MAKVMDAGVNSFKFFFAYKGAFMVTDETYLKGLLRCKELGALPMVSHACFMHTQPLRQFCWYLACLHSVVRPVQCSACTHLSCPEPQKLHPNFVSVSNPAAACSCSKGQDR